MEIDSEGFITLDLLYQPERTDWEEVNVYSAIEHAIERAQLFVGDFSQFVIVDTSAQDEVFVYSIYSLIRLSITSLIVWARLLALSKNILIKVTQTDTEITLKVSGYDPLSSQMDFIDEQACSMCKEVVELIVSILGGSLNWETKQVIPNEDELVIRLSKKSTE